MPMSAVVMRRGRFGEFELRPVREHAVEAVPGDDTENFTVTEEG